MHIELVRSLVSRLKAEQGQTLIEYVLVVFIVGIGLVTALFFLQDTLVEFFSNTGSQLDNTT